MMLAHGLTSMSLMLSIPLRYHRPPSIGLYDDRTKSKFLNYGKFDLFAALSFPDADLKHLTTCLMFFFWAFSVCSSYLMYELC